MSVGNFDNITSWTLEGASIVMMLGISSFPIASRATAFTLTYLLHFPHKGKP